LTEKRVTFGLLAICQPFTGPKEAQDLLELARYFDGSRFDAMFYVDHFFLAFMPVRGSRI
jgi:hypothetical protein